MITEEYIEEKYNKLSESRQLEYHNKLRKLIETADEASNAKILLGFSQDELKNIFSLLRKLKIIFVGYGIVVALICIISHEYYFLNILWPIIPVWVVCRVLIAELLIVKTENIINGKKIELVRLNNIGISIVKSATLFEKQVEMSTLFNPESDKHYLEVKNRIIAAINNMSS